MKDIIQEDWEMNKEQIFIEEYKRDYEAQYWEWYEKSEGKVLIKNQDGTTTEVDETINEGKLPF